LIPLRSGEPIRFGPDGEYGVTASGWGGFDIGKVSEIGEDNLVVHDPTIADTAYSFALSRLGDQNLTHTPTGIFRQVARPTYDDQARAQVEDARVAKTANLQSLLTGKDTWTVLA
jgi:2-oxoglutarate ferredoxin oxidoreductase subunit beta